MKLLIEIILYGLQIVSVFLVAGPVMARAERQRSLSRNPGWAASDREFLQAHRQPPLLPLTAVGMVFLVLLAVAGIMASPMAAFAVHGPLFALAAGCLYAYYWKKETDLRKRIPGDSVQRADLSVRTLSRFLGPWSLIPLIALATAGLAVNVYGALTGAMIPGRSLGNLVFLCVSAGLIAFALSQSLRRPAYRTSGETDTQGRTLELRIVLAVGYLMAAVALYHALGSLGSDPLLPMPPTLMHAKLEGAHFSWSHFLHAVPYRAVDYAATVFLIAMGPLIAGSPFYRKVLTVDFGTAPRPSDI